MTTTATNTLPLSVYDCFSDQRFGGNIGGIVFDAGELQTERMQKIAGEINAPVTGFVTGRRGNEISIRFFMPAAEIAMCGHVTVGLFTHLSDDDLDQQEFVMKAPAGDVAVKVTRDGGRKNVLMQLGTPKELEGAVDIDALASALGISKAEFADIPVEKWDAGLRHIFVVFRRLDTVRRLAPDFEALASLSRLNDVHTVEVICKETVDPSSSLHVRDFCPAVGSNEVPASGTTNGALMGFAVKHGLVEKAATVVMLVEQGAELGRPSKVRVEADLDGNAIVALRVGGQAVESYTGLVNE